MKYVLMFSLVYLTCVSLAFSENLLGRYFPVYVNSENIYHFYKCDLLTSNKEMYSISEVIEKGMDPCEVCQPPNKYDPENYTKVKLPQSGSKSSSSDVAAQKKQQTYATPDNTFHGDPTEHFTNIKQKLHMANYYVGEINKRTDFEGRERVERHRFLIKSIEEEIALAEAQYRSTGKVKNGINLKDISDKLDLVNTTLREVSPK